jgi:Ca2+/Na+ antiporter
MFQILRKIYAGIIYGGTQSSIFNSLAGGDPKKEEEITLFTTKILHITFLCAVLVMIITIIVIIIVSTEGTLGKLDANIIVSMYFSHICAIAIAIVWPKIINWQKWSNKSKIGIFINHSIRVFFIIILVIAEFVGVISGNISFYIALPLYLLSIFALYITFPTRRRWKKWTEGTSSID